MKKLILMRHGDAPRNVMGDNERSLSSQGQDEAAQTSHYIKDLYEVNYILCSTAKRNKQTLEVLQTITLQQTPVEFCDEIYQNDPSILKDLVYSCKPEISTILILGHNPSLLTFALECDKNGYSEWIDEINHGFLPAEIIVIEFSVADNWEDAMRHGGKIKDIFIPK